MKGLFLSMIYVIVVVWQQLHPVVAFFPLASTSRHSSWSSRTILLQSNSNDWIDPPHASAESVATSLWETRDLFQTSVHAIVKCPGEEDDGGSKDDPFCRLAYMPCRNRGEIIRLILEEAGVEYELEVVGFQKWEQYVKASTPQGKLPVLRQWKGQELNLGQEQAITRFLAKELNLAGKTPLEQARVDELYCQWMATLRNNGISHDGEHFSVAALKEGREKEERLTRLDVIRYQDMFRQNTFSRVQRSLTALRYFEEVLEENGTGFLVGDSPTYVDFGLFYILFELSEEDNVPDFAQHYDFPTLGAFLQHIQDRPQIMDYLQSPRRMPRYQRDANGASLYTYVAGKHSPDLSRQQQQEQQL